MAKKKTDPTQVLREFALQLPEAEEGDSCNKSAFRARNKAFLYIGGKDRSFNLMLRLDDSLPVAEECESNSPGNYTVGKGGWTKVAHKFDDDVPVA
ncbi:MAG: hypothetical protein QF805_26700, partial [Pirellulaceae bacterium]|nr:hypothetical protein [Pirellulaceae bacterium]